MIYRSVMISSSQVISLVRPRRRLSLAPTAEMLTPSSAGRVKAGRSCGHTARLGLDATEHDGTLLRSGGLFPLLAYRRNIRPTAECIVLFAVGPVSSPHHGLRRLRRRYVPNAIRLCREKKRAVAETRPSRDDVSL